MDFVIYSGHRMDTRNNSVRTMTLDLIDISRRHRAISPSFQYKKGNIFSDRFFHVKSPQEANVQSKGRFELKG